MRGIIIVLLLNLTCLRGKTLGPELGILAEIASLQLEYTYLAKLTQNVGYWNRVRVNLSLNIWHNLHTSRSPKLS